MKIEWMNDELTRVRVTRGFFRRRKAEMRWTPASGWHYTVSGTEVDFDLRIWLCGKREKEIRRREQEANWTSATPFPKAQLVKR